MISRTKDQVWPVVAELLDVYVQESKASSYHLSCDSEVTSDATRRRSFATEREKLLFSILDFLSRIYGERKCGLGLSSLIPVAGTLVLPFLATEGELHARAMKALKTMMLIDCDALWRPLLQLSHRPLPPSPFGLQRSIVVVEDRYECSTPLELGAEELIGFVESLPEQSIDRIV